jgi:hypothetical protein
MSSFDLAAACREAQADDERRQREREKREASERAPFEEADAANRLELAHVLRELVRAKRGAAR